MEFAPPSVARTSRTAAPRPATAGSARERRNPGYARFAWGVLGFNLFVILWGAFVRASGSGAGCGSHWPLCNGEVVPRSPAAATLIEFGHRLTSGLDVLLVGGLVVGAWRAFPPRHAVRRAALLSALFLVSEALIGAGLVLLEHVAADTSVGRGVWVAGHLVNTFVLVGCLGLTAWWASDNALPRGDHPRSLLLLVGAALVGVLLISVSGAVTALGDTLFPAATLAEAKAQTFSQTAHLFVRLRIWHPTLALIVGLLVVCASGFAVTYRRTRAVQTLAVTVVALYGVQLGVGAANVWFLAPLVIQLTHLLVSDVIWILLILMTASVLTVPDTATAAPPPR
jgi:heme A synthase